MGIPIMAN